MLVLRGGCDVCDNVEERSSCDLMDVLVLVQVQKVRVRGDLKGASAGLRSVFRVNSTKVWVPLVSRAEEDPYKASSVQKYKDRLCRITLCCTLPLCTEAVKV